MRRLFLSIIALSLASFCIPIPVQAAYQSGAVVQLPNVAAIASKSLADTVQINLSGYYTSNDGGQGVFVLKTCTPDGGSCIADGTTPTPNTFQRTNLNGDVRQYGITQGSAYDATTHLGTATDAEPVLTSMFTALTAAGLTNISTNGVSIYLGETLTLPDYFDLDCGVTATGPYNNGQYWGHPGTIVTAHGATVKASGNIDQQAFSSCLRHPQWYVNPSVVSQFGGISFTFPPQTYDDLEAIRANESLSGDTGVFFQGSRNGRMQNLGIYCFDTGIEQTQPNENQLSSIKIDSSVGLYSLNGGSGTAWENVHVQNYCTKQVQDPNGNIIPTSQAWSISSISPSPTNNSFGTPLCRLVITGGVDNENNILDPRTAFKSSVLNAQGSPVEYPVWLANLVNTDGTGNGVACKGNGAWGITVISANSTTATLDLLGSDYGTGADAVQTTATWKSGTQDCTPQPCTVIRITSGDFNALQGGMTVTNASFPSGTRVIQPLQGEKGDDPYDGAIGSVIVDHLATAPATTDAVVSFDGGTYTQLDPCAQTVLSGSVDKFAACLYFDVTQRPFAGTSDGGKFTAIFPLSNGISYGADFAINGTVGIKANKNQSFSHYYSILSKDANGISIVQHGADDSNKANDIFGSVGIYALGTTNRGLFSGGISGSGIFNVTDLENVSQSVSNRTTTTAGTGTGLVTLTTSSSISGWSADPNGYLPVSLCLTLNASNQCVDGDVGTEYATAHILGSNSLKLTDRGQFGTYALSIAKGWHVVQSSVGNANGIINIDTAGVGTTGVGAVDFLWLHGGVSLSNSIAKDTGLIGYVSNNIMQSIFTANLFNDMTIYYSGSAGFSSSRGCGNRWAISYSWECLGSSPVASGTILDLTAHDWTCDASAGQKTLILPAATNATNFFYTITKIDTSVNLCIIDTTGSDMVGGASDVILGVLNDAISIKNANGTTWIVQ